MEHNHGGLVQSIFLSNWVICRFQPLIFQGVSILFLEPPQSPNQLSRVFFIRPTHAADSIFQRRQKGIQKMWLLRNLWKGRCNTWLLNPKIMGKMFTHQIIPFVVLFALEPLFSPSILGVFNPLIFGWKRPYS